MNNITITYQKAENNYNIKVDGNAISPYSELNNYLNKPMLEWAHALWGTIEAELNDEYRVAIVGDEFEKLFLNELKWRFPECASCIAMDYEIDYTFEMRLEMVKRVAEKMGISLPEVVDKFKVYTEVEIKLDETFAEKAEMQDAWLCVVNDAAQVKVVGVGEAKVYILPSQENKVTHLGNTTYLWEMSSFRIAEVVDAAVTKFARYKWLNAFVEELKAADAMEQEDLETLALALATEEILIIEDIPAIEVGKSYEVQVKRLPANGIKTPFESRSSNRNVAEIFINTIFARGVGVAELEFVKIGSVIPFAKKTVEVFRDAQVQKIELSVDRPLMGVGDSQALYVTCYPNDADDIPQMEISSDAPNVVSITEDGKIVAVHGGRATITAKTTKASAQITVDVSYNLERIVLEEKEIALSVGEKKEVKVRLEPANCVNGEYVWSSNNENAACVMKDELGNEIIRATGIGVAVLTCRAKDGSCEESIVVDVKSRLYKRPDGTSNTSAYNATSTSKAVSASSWSAPEVKIWDPDKSVRDNLKHNMFHKIAVILLLLVLILGYVPLNVIALVRGLMVIGAVGCIIAGYVTDKETKLVSIILGIVFLFS